MRLRNLLLCVLSAGLSAISLANGSELILNCSFENDLPQGLVLNNSTIVNEGKNATHKVLKLMGEKSTAIIKDIKLKPGERYKLSYQAKAGEKVLTTTGFQYFRVFVSCLNQKNGLEWQDTWQNSYQNKELIFTVPKRGSGHLNTTITCELNDGGSLLLDNLKLEQIEAEKNPDVKITLIKPFFRNIIYNTDPISQIEGFIEASTETSTINIKLIEQDSNSSVFEKKYSTVKDSVSFLIPVANLKDNKYTLSIIPYDINGNMLKKEEISIWKLGKSPIEVIYKNDMNCYINGKIFYPVMFWHIVRIVDPRWDSEDEIRLALYNARKNGVNTFLFYPGIIKNTLSLLNIAKELDCKIVLEFENASKIDKEHLKEWKHAVSNKLTPEIIAHEALLGYSLTDEPMWRGVPLENLIESYNFLKETDPYRPVWTNEAPRGEIKHLREYSAAADIWGIDIYPVPAPNNHSSIDDKGLTSVGKYTQICREVVQKRKPIWMILQAFSWHTYHENRPKVYPDKTQSAFMAFDCIVNGAQAILYFGMESIDDPSFYDTLFDTTKKLSVLSGVITLPEASSGLVKCDNPAIKFSTKEKDGKIYIIAVNESEKENEAKFTGQFKTSPLNVVFENRKIISADNSFSDKFIPYDTHIYASGELPEKLIKELHLNETLDKKASPFIEHANGKKNIIKYTGNAQWIWFPGKSSESGSKVALKKEFTLDKIPQNAEMIITADDYYVLYVNGKKVGAEGSCLVALIYDIKNYLKEGINTIYVEAADSGAAPCAFIADISLLDIHGNKRNIISDTSWEAMEINSFSGPDTQFKGIPSEKVAEHGKGPWGVIRLIKAKQ